MSCTKCDLENAILDFKDWSWWSLQSDGYTRMLNDTEVVVLSTQLSEDDEYPQGFEGTCWILFKSGDEFFKKFGTFDSYGTRSWDGRFKKVYPVEKTILEYA